MQRNAVAGFADVAVPALGMDAPAFFALYTIAFYQKKNRCDRCRMAVINCPYDLLLSRYLKSMKKEFV